MINRKVYKKVSPGDLCLFEIADLHALSKPTVEDIRENSLYIENLI